MEPHWVTSNCDQLGGPLVDRSMAAMPIAVYDFVRNDRRSHDRKAETVVKSNEDH
jgi:hypothetical protein